MIQNAMPSYYDIEWENSSGKESLREYRPSKSGKKRVSFLQDSKTAEIPAPLPSKSKTVSSSLNSNSNSKKPLKKVTFQIEPTVPPRTASMGAAILRGDMEYQRPVLNWTAWILNGGKSSIPSNSSKAKKIQSDKDDEESDTLTWVSSTVSSILTIFSYPMSKPEEKIDLASSTGPVSKRDSAIDLSDEIISSIKPVKQKALKDKLCTLCSGNTMFKYKICQRCDGTGVLPSTGFFADLFSSGKRIFNSVSLWSIFLPQPATPNELPLYRPKNRPLSREPKERNPRSSLDPGPQSEWARTLDYKTTSKQKIAFQQKQRWSTQFSLSKSLDNNRPLSKSLDNNRPLSFPLSKIAKTVQEPSEIDFSDFVSRHC